MQLMLHKRHWLVLHKKIDRKVVDQSAIGNLQHFQQPESQQSTCARSNSYRQAVDRHVTTSDPLVSNQLERPSAIYAAFLTCGSHSKTNLQELWLWCMVSQTFNGQPCQNIRNNRTLYFLYIEKHTLVLSDVLFRISITRDIFLHLIKNGWQSRLHWPYLW